MQFRPKFFRFFRLVNIFYENTGFILQKGLFFSMEKSLIESPEKANHL